MNRATVVFLLIAFVPAWVIRIGLYVLKPEWGDRDVMELGTLLAMGCPALAAYLVRRFMQGDAAFTDLLTRASPFTYLGVIALTLLQAFIPAVIALATGQAKPLRTFDATTVTYLLLYLCIPWLFGFGEEFGWRAFLFKSFAARSLLQAYVVTGIAVNFWHEVPQVMRALQEQTEIATPLQLFSLAIGGAVFLVPTALCQSVIAGWLYLRTGDVWLVAVWHGYWHGFRNAARWLAVGIAETNLQVIATSIDVVAAVLLLTFGKALKPAQSVIINRETNRNE